MTDSKLIFPFTDHSTDIVPRNVSHFTKFGFVENNKDVIDLGLGNCGCFTLGFDREDFIDSVSKKLKTNPTSTGEFLLTNEHVLEFAQKLYDISGGYRSVFALSGSDSIEASVKLSHMYHVQKGSPKTHIIGFEYAYHGSTFMSTSISGCDYIYDYYGRHDKCHSSPYDLEKLEQLINSLNNDVSCIVIETCSWQMGMYNLPKEFWQGLRAICDKYDIILVVDDIAMCGGKTGTFLGFENLVKPDIFTLGKALTGGFYPLSACMVSERVYDYARYQILQHGFTYSFSMPGILSALHYIKCLEEENVYDNYPKILENSLDIFDYLKNNNVISDYRHHGLMFHLDLNKERPFNDDFETVCTKHGISIGIWNDMKEGVLICIPLNADEQYFTDLKNRLENAILEYYSLVTVSN